jgi:hypothetical protein
MKGRTDMVVRKVLTDIGASLVMKSPVGDRDKWQENIYRASKGLPPTPAGYVGGRFKGNWSHGFGKAPVGEFLDIDPSGSSSMARITGGVAASPVAGIHYLANNLPYAQRLEDGYSTQAPNGMMELTLIEFPGIVKRAQA